MAGTHFKGPILFSAQRPALENLNTGMWPDQVYYMDDFYAGALDETHKWTIIKDAGATVAVLADTVNGEVELRSAAGVDNDGGSIQGKHEFLALPTTAGEKLYFETRLKTVGATSTDIFVGLGEVFITNPENIFNTNNQIAFVLTEGTGGVITGRTKSGGTTTTVTLSPTADVTLADDTFITLGFVATKGTTTDKVEFFVNRKKVGTSTTNIPTANMKPQAASISGILGGDAMNTKLDYIMAAKDRDVSYPGQPT
jgi:hypothetical protein